MYDTYIAENSPIRQSLRIILLPIRRPAPKFKDVIIVLQAVKRKNIWLCQFQQASRKALVPGVRGTRHIERVSSYQERRPHTHLNQKNSLPTRRIKDRSALSEKIEEGLDTHRKQFGTGNPNQRVERTRSWNADAEHMKGRGVWFSGAPTEAVKYRLRRRNPFVKGEEISVAAHPHRTRNAHMASHACSIVKESASAGKRE